MGGEYELCWCNPPWQSCRPQLFSSPLKPHGEVLITWMGLTAGDGWGVRAVLMQPTQTELQTSPFFQPPESSRWGSDYLDGVSRRGWVGCMSCTDAAHRDRAAGLTFSLSPRNLMMVWLSLLLVDTGSSCCKSPGPSVLLSPVVSPLVSPACAPPSRADDSSPSSSSPADLLLEERGSSFRMLMMSGTRVKTDLKFYLRFFFFWGGGGDAIPDFFLCSLWGDSACQAREKNV